MPVRVEDYRDRFGVSKVEQELAKALRREPEEERFRIIQQLMWDPHLADWRVAFDLVRKCLTQRESLEKVLEQGLMHGNPSSIRAWLDAVEHGLGFRHMVEFLTEKLSSYPKGVIFGRYWLRVPTTQGQERGKEALRSLDDSIAEKVWGDPELPRLLGELYMESLRAKYKPRVAATP